MPQHPRPDRSDLSSPGPADETARLRAELERARQQLAFYAGFDQTIRDNVARSAELLRQAEAARAEADRAAAAARQEAARLRAEREAWQAAVAARVAAVRAGVDDLERLLGHAATATDFTDDPRVSAGGLAAVGAPEARGLESEPVTGTPISSEPVTMSIIVHGVPDVRTAQALQGRLAGIGALERVVAREFMAGVARFEAVGRGLSADDLRGWDGAGGPLPVTLRPELVELAYPGALAG